MINLREQYGHKYRIGHDEAAITWAERSDPCMMTIRCKRGVIYPFGDETLAVEVDNRPQIARRVASIEGVALYQDGDREKTFLFPISVLEQVAAHVLPYKRYRMTEEHKKEVTERLLRWKASREGADSC